MSAEATENSREQPLIVLVCRVELLGEALRGALDEIAEVQMFRAGLGDTDGLLRSLRPDAVVVDDTAEAEAALAFANRMSRSSRFRTAMSSCGSTSTASGRKRPRAGSHPRPCETS